MSTPLFCECDRCKAYLELKVHLPYLFFAVANLTKRKDCSTSGKGWLALRKAMTGTEDIDIAAIRRDVLTIEEMREAKRLHIEKIENGWERVCVRGSARWTRGDGLAIEARHKH
ncbi:hypothetical protein HBI49_013610 [Parastagonospora nodorum]|nr:hypothetical protein HBI10_132720 [Parastagonospora nodorum]KAH5379108.1 hypothetical protein HBI49_013610 [Parastagonospora nodorum]KAH5728296.1 hypothetical protein HBI20_059840 [Parastagonospora nodorum]KAH6290555.1 hypothetical protein HBI39_199050 [Parastagonospora nodorum]KAH6549937.1 hypothetical protein HBI07_046800 [Parastagonospora nodorum]